MTEWPDRFVFVHYSIGKASEHKFNGCAVRNNQFRFVNNKALYDIRIDPGETKNVSGDHPEVVAQMRAAYDKWWEEVLPALAENESAADSDHVKKPKKE